MRYEIADGAAGPVLVLRGQLTLKERDVFDSLIDRLVGYRSSLITVDLAGLDYMDSAGLGMLLTLRDRAGRADARVQLARPQGDVKELLDLACFDSLFVIEPA